MENVAFVRLHRAGKTFPVMVVSFLVSAACGTGSATNTTAVPETSEAPETTVEKEVATAEELQKKALRNCPKSGEVFTQDTQSYAEAYGLSYEEAVRRMRIGGVLFERPYGSRT